MPSKRRLFRISIIFLFLFQMSLVYPANTLGLDKPTNEASPAKPAITLEQAVQTVKDNFTIPEQYNQFSSGFYDNNQREIYSLHWSTSAEPYGNINADVDAYTGEIINMYQYDNISQSRFKLPALSAAEAEKIAINLVTKLAGNYMNELKLVNDIDQVQPLNYFGPYTYNFRWIRTVNGIPFPANSINVSVRGEDGLVTSYNFNWNREVHFPDSSGAISAEKAREVFTNTPLLQLRYHLAPVINPQIPKPRQVFLVYQPSTLYFESAIDALTGMPITVEGLAANPIYSSKNALLSSSTVSTLTSTPPLNSLSLDVKQEATSSISKATITRDQAIEIVKKYINIPDNLELRNSSLNPDWENPDVQVWNLDWGNNNYEPRQQRYLNARVNATSGELVSFNESPSGTSENVEPISRSEAQKIAEDFLLKIQPERLKQVKLEPSIPYYGKGAENLLSFNYIRLVNGIPVSNNNINITVDAVAKRITNYNLSWTNTEFPSTENTINLNQANESYLKTRPLTLNYILIYQGSEPKEARLVYQPQLNQGMYVPTMLNAKTGEFIDWYGRPESQWIKPHRFTDIQGNFAEKEISILGLMGAFPEYGDTFRPDEKITVRAFLKTMLMTNGYAWDRILSDEEILKMAKERGWLKEDLNLTSELSRETLSKIVIRMLGLSASAEVRGIYQVPFKDASSIQLDSLGYIALSWGLGVLKVDGEYLNPSQTITRAEAAYALIHAYAVERPIR